MKICPKCESQNPSMANCCMNCGALLDEIKPNKEEKLQIKLNKANETIDQLNILLAEYEKKIEILEIGNKTEPENRLSSEEKKKYEKIISEKETESSNLKKRLSSFKKRKNVYLTLALFFFLICIVSVIMYNDLNSENQNKANQISTLQSKTQNLGSENENNKDQISSLTIENENLKNEINSLKEQQPVLYKVVNDIAYCHSLCSNSFYETGCHYNRGSSVFIYSEKDGYGLAMSGWLRMSDLEKY